MQFVLAKQLRRNPRMRMRLSLATDAGKLTRMPTSSLGPQTAAFGRAPGDGAPCIR